MHLDCILLDINTLDVETCSGYDYVIKKIIILSACVKHTEKLMPELVHIYHVKIYNNNQ
jgi:hypothetical protein